MTELKIPCCFCDEYIKNNGKCEGLTQFEIDNASMWLSPSCFKEKAVSE